MSRPDSVTGCESDEISQKMCLGDAVGASDLHNAGHSLFSEAHKQTGLPHKICEAVLFTNYYMGRITSKEDENLPAQAAASLQNNH